MARRMWACVLLAVSACWTATEAERLPPVVPVPRVAPPPEPRREVPRADAVLAEMRETYANAKTYVDHGSQVSLSPVHVAPTRTSFATVYERPGMLRYEISVDLGVATEPVSTVWSIGSEVFVVERDKLVEHAPRLGTAIEQSIGTQIGLPSAIRLLEPQASTSSDVTRLDDPSVAGEDTIDGHACWQVVGRGADQSAVTLSIDERSHVLRRIYQVHHHANLDETEITTFDPILDAPIEATQLAGPDLALAPPPPPPLPLPDRWIGVNYDELLEVVSVVPGSPADTAGLRPHDHLVVIDGEAVHKSTDVRARIVRVAIGHVVHVRVIRNGALVDLTPVVAKRPAVIAAPVRTPAPTVNRPAPPFDVPVLSGANEPRLALAALAGHVVVLDFWATWCGPCALTMPGLEALHAAHAAAGLRVIGVSNEDEPDIREFLAKHPLAYAIARDEDGKLFPAYGIGPIPVLVAIDKRGRARGTFVGAGHDREVEALVATLLAE